MNLPTLDNLKVKNKRVLLRLDLDVPIDKDKVLDDSRLQAAVPTIRYLSRERCLQIIILGHRGRPKGKKDKNLSLNVAGEHLENLLKKKLGEKVSDKLNIFMFENLRFNPGEEENDMDFAKSLAGKGDVYVNDAFAVSHRKHASIVSLPKLLPRAAGLHLVKEVTTLSKILDAPREPVVIVLGGGKIGKAFLVDKLLDHAEWVLVGGVLPEKVKSFCRGKDGRMCVVAAKLVGGERITEDSAKNFAHIISTAGTVVWDGPMGDIDHGFWEGTRIVGEAVASSSAFKAVGGGDTIRALRTLRLADKMDYISTGGGAMLEFLAYGDLPGLKALRE